MRKLLIITALCMLGLGVQAAQELTVNGEIVQKTVATMSFDGENVILTFSDQTSQSVDMSAVVLKFDVGETAIYSVKLPVGSLLDLGNMESGTEIVIYDATGKKILSKKSDQTSASISVENLKSGIYILKAGRQIVKFVKR